MMNRQEVTQMLEEQDMPAILEAQEAAERLSYLQNLHLERKRAANEWFDAVEALERAGTVAGNKPDFIP